jgi:enoyl-CoA hydratase
VSGAIHGLALLPEKRLRVAMYTCEPIPAEELVAYGAIHRLVPADELVKVALDLAAVIAGKDPGTIRRAKATINGAVGRDLRAKYRQELSYSYELKMLGRADQVRQQFVDGNRAAYDVTKEAP